MTNETYQFKYSANLGFLWRDQPFLLRIDKAHAAGFAAIEFHDDVHEQDLVALQDTLDEYRMPVISLNTKMGDSLGVAAVPGKESEAHRNIDEAIELATHLQAGAVHVMAGKAEGPGATALYINNLKYALSNCDSLEIFIEPISHERAPGYFLNELNQAEDILRKINNPNLRIMFDCFHIRHQTEDVAGAFAKYARHVGHVQIASYPDRNEPDTGELDYARLLPDIVAAGYSGYFGCEYLPATTVEEGLGWRERLGAD